MSGRTPDEADHVGEDNLEAARVLAGEGRIRGQEFLERLARSDGAIEDDEREPCGLSHNIFLGAQLAREMLEAGEYEDVVKKWAGESRRRWENSKFVRL